MIADKQREDDSKVESWTGSAGIGGNVRDLGKTTELHGKKFDPGKLEEKKMHQRVTLRLWKTLRFTADQTMLIWHWIKQDVRLPPGSFQPPDFVGNALFRKNYYPAIMSFSLKPSPSPFYELQLKLHFYGR